ncbi:hypothetical protein B9479_003392 [Cryptococcus floricola]|uniref:R3H domain-containing protein n=1 Tax=Cryptococcus floricola TaxID=2591691 RepID=A0A5D3B041_9TREE|nr:hypothetical protein B9479_003392 [Cryptococcus floricola]
MTESSKRTNPESSQTRKPAPNGNAPVSGEPSRPGDGSYLLEQTARAENGRRQGQRGRAPRNGKQGERKKQGNGRETQQGTAEGSSASTQTPSRERREVNARTAGPQSRGQNGRYPQRHNPQHPHPTGYRGMQYSVPSFAYDPHADGEGATNGQQSHVHSRGCDHSGPSNSSKGNLRPAGARNEFSEEVVELRSPQPFFPNAAVNNTVRPSPALMRSLNSVRVPQLREDAPLDAAALSFVPGAALLATDLDEHPSSPKTAQREEAKTTGKKGNKGKKPNQGVDTTQQGPAVATGRRAAFEQSTKLTSMKPKGGKTMKPGQKEDPAQGVVSAKKQDKKSAGQESDDLVTRLTKSLKNRPLVECPICFNSITPSQQTWCCLPPDRPPEPSSSATLHVNPITGSTATSTHYSACYTPFHLECIRDWAKRSLGEEDEKIRSGLKEPGEAQWSSFVIADEPSSIPLSRAALKLIAHSLALAHLRNVATPKLPTNATRTRNALPARTSPRNLVPVVKNNTSRTSVALKTVSLVVKHVASCFLVASTDARSSVTNPESVILALRCVAVVTQTCSCGNLLSRTSCGASTLKPKSREAEQLKCNSECAVRQRNARLADALGIKQPGEKNAEVYEDELKNFALGNHKFVKMVENTFEEFFKGPRQSMVLPHMPESKRTIVMSLADHYRLTRELIDQEPNRSVQIRRRIDTRIPKPLLSAAVNPSQAGPTRLVTTSAGPWGRTTAGSSGTAASIVAGSGSGSGSSRLSTTVTRVAGGSALNSTVPSRTTTPVIPAPFVPSIPASVSAKRSEAKKREEGGEGENKPVGQVDDDDDWDKDDVE